MSSAESATSRSGKRLPRVIDRTSDPADLADAILLIDKPQGWTSFDVIRHLRRHTGIRKIGHAGTLDPIASGLLICMTGKATKQMASLVSLDKTYTGTVRLGESTPSYDAETSVTDKRDASHISKQDVVDAATQFVGTFVQYSPPYSAIKRGGERLYKKARRGEHVDAPPRVVTVDEFRIIRLNETDADFSVTCSKGTYVRSLAHDLGETLGVGGHLVSLRRTSIGHYHVDDALSIEETVLLCEPRFPRDSAADA